LPYPDLFIWWVVCISWSIVFLTLVSFFLYADSKTRRGTKGVIRWMRDFVFVWVLIGLLALYVVSVNIGSAELFAQGNIVVELILVVYLVSNRMKTPEEPSITREDGKFGPTSE